MRGEGLPPLGELGHPGCVGGIGAHVFRSGCTRSAAGDHPHLLLALQELSGDSATHRSRSVPRARVRAEMTEEIKTIARGQLAALGADLSLRAVARELGMVSSAVYRHFPSRDDLLTVLIVDGYHAMGRAAEAADAGVDPADLRGRFRAVGHALRDWAVEHPAEYALLYGSPVPGYHAPAHTVDAAGRTALVFGEILRAAVTAGRLTDDATAGLSPRVRADLTAATSGAVLYGVPEPVADRALAAWVQMYGAISFELFGHLAGTIDHPQDRSDHQLNVLADTIGL